MPAVRVQKAARSRQTLHGAGLPQVQNANDTRMTRK